MTNQSIDVQAEAWFAQFTDALESKNIDAVCDLFMDGCFWRDLLTFTWNVKTMEGKYAIADMLRNTLPNISPKEFTMMDRVSLTDGVLENWFTFETDDARGEGIFRLIDGKCLMLFTAMKELIGHEEPEGRHRPLGSDHKAKPNRATWADMKAQRQESFGTTEQPWCMVIGGAQSGIALGARLKQLNVPTLIIEQNEKPGDAWRNRYDSLVLHDPVWYDHMPYIPFPDHWPIFAPRDQIAQWLDMYTQVMELDYWGSTRCVSAEFDETAKKWTVELERNGKSVTLSPTHIVFATGVAGSPQLDMFEGQDTFKGKVMHSSQYKNGDGLKGKKCMVVGVGSSGHDVALDLFEHGAKVTIIQRSPSTIIRSDTLMDLGFGAIYSEKALENGIDVDMADTIFASLPFRIHEQQGRELSKAIAEHDAEFYEGLEKAGFMHDFGEDDTGLLMKAFRSASGYYIDVGASDQIINGNIAVKAGHGVKCLTENGLMLENGEEIEADCVIGCLGYGAMTDPIGKIISTEVQETIGKAWGMGSGIGTDNGPWEGELRNLWKPTAQENLWIHAGNLALSRYYSKFIAMQLKARMEGIATPVYGGPE